MAHRSRFLFALGILLASTAGAAPTAPADAAFGWLKGLAGTWKGTPEWSGGRTGRGEEMTAVYSTTGNGSAVVENLMVGGVAMMTSVYHEDGADLRMTHYCAARNQPRLKASSIDEEKKIVHFRMVDMTGRPGGHVDEAEVRFSDARHVTILFTVVGPGEPSVERIDLEKVGD